jgi:hypothetical protein
VHRSRDDDDPISAEEQMQDGQLRLAGWIAADALLAALIIAALFHGMFVTPLILAVLLTGAVAETMRTMACIDRNEPK